MGNGEMGNGKWARAQLFCDICAVAMGCGLWAVGFKRSAARHCVVIGAARLAAGGGIKQNRRVATPELLIANC